MSPRRGCCGQWWRRKWPWKVCESSTLTLLFSTVARTQGESASCDINVGFKTLSKAAAAVTTTTFYLYSFTVLHCYVSLRQRGGLSAANVLYVRLIRRKRQLKWCSVWKAIKWSTVESQSNNFHNSKPNGEGRRKQREKDKSSTFMLIFFLF